MSGAGFSSSSAFSLLNSSSSFSDENTAWREQIQWLTRGQGGGVFWSYFLGAVYLGFEVFMIDVSFKMHRGEISRPRYL